MLHKTKDDVTALNRECFFRIVQKYGE